MNDRRLAMKWVKRLVIRLLDTEASPEAVQQAAFARVERREHYHGRPW